MPNQIDLNYKPHSYFWANEMGIKLSSQIKGAHRKALYDASLSEDRNDSLDEFLQKESLNKQERDLWGKLHPRFMGGEYLPDRDNEEVEIARITINSTTQDVTSVYASLRENHIHYRVVDEYEGETLSDKNELLTETPMTLAELTDFFLTAWPLLEVLEMNFGTNDCDPDDIRLFVRDASSDFYSQFGELICLKVDEWIAEKGFLKNNENTEEFDKEIESLEDQNIQKWIDKSEWPKSTLRDAQGLGALAENSQRKKAVIQYIKKFIDKNKTYPTGTHIIDEVIPVLGGDFSGIPNKFNFTVIFPEK